MHSSIMRTTRIRIYCMWGDGGVGMMSHVHFPGEWGLEEGGGVVTCSFGVDHFPSPPELDKQMSVKRIPVFATLRGR